MTVRHLSIDRREDYAESTGFGNFGEFERLECSVEYAVDPLLSANRCITDIESADRDEDGRVVFTGNLSIVKPKHRPPRCLLIDVPNRGRRISYGMFNRPDPQEAMQNACPVGDGFLFRHGFAIASVGWQFDADPMRVHVPSAKLDGESVRGEAICQMQPSRNTRSLYLGQLGAMTYLPKGTGRMYQREYTNQQPKLMDSADWEFGRFKDGAVHPATDFVCKRNGEFQAGKIYTLVFDTEGAPIVGLGLLALRDATSALRYGEFDWQGDPPEFAIAFGASQTGRVLRHFLYLGLNDDAQGRAVFDVVIPHIAGGQRGDFNHRFAQPSSAGVPACGQLFPFAGPETTDPYSTQEDGIFEKAKHAPKVISTNTSWEYWRGDAALVHTTPDGSLDVTEAPYERRYLFAGTHHINGSTTLTRSLALSGDQVSYPLNMISYTPLIRAVLINALRWLETGDPPPPSQVPLIADGSATAREQVLEKFKGSADFPQVLDATHLTGLSEIDLGDDADRGICRFPAVQGRNYPSLVCDVNAELNERAGIRLPEVVLDIGIHTGWNPRHRQHGAPEQMAMFAGSSVFDGLAWLSTPAAEVKGQIALVARNLVADRYVLEEDFALVIQNAEHRLAIGLESVKSGTEKSETY